MEHTAWKLDTVDEDEVVSWVMKCQHESAVGLYGSVVLLLQQIIYSSCVLFDVHYLMAIHCHFSDGYTSISQTNWWLTLHDF